MKHLKQIQRRLPAEQILELVRQYEAGAPVFELAEIFEIDQSTVHGHLNRQNVPRRPYRKLWGERLDEAIRLQATGMSIRGIARELGVNRGTVAAALRNTANSETA
ncbi:MAG: hypothetical protein ABIX10_14455 [Acidimicrobiales bacterium]